MKLNKIIRDCNAVSTPAGTEAVLHLACLCEFTNTRDPRTYETLRDITPTPSGVTLPAVENVLAESVTYGEPFTFNSGSGFTKYDIVLQSGGVDTKTEGEMQFLSDTAELTFSIKGDDAQVMGFKQMLMNRPLIAIISSVDGKDSKVLGHINFPAYVTQANSSSGKKASDPRKTDFVIQDVSGIVARSYPIATLHPSGLPLASFS